MDRGNETGTDMLKESSIRAEKLEARLNIAKTRKQRDRLFRELCDLYVEDLYADSIKWAYARKTREPIDDGPAAVARAFVLVYGALDDPANEDKPLLYWFKGTIWSEIGHIKAEQILRFQRGTQLDQEVEEPVDIRSRTQQALEAWEELNLLRNYAKTPAQQRLFRAGQLKASGYSWEEAAAEVHWEGPVEALRTSFSRLKRELRERIDAHIHP